MKCWKRDYDHLKYGEKWHCGLKSVGTEDKCSALDSGLITRNPGSNQFHLSIGMAMVGYCHDWMHVIKLTVSLVIFSSSILCG